MRVLIDSNVFLRLAHRHHPQTATADQALTQLGNQGSELRIVPQVAYVYWVVATRPADRNGLGFGVEVVDADVERIKSLFNVLRDERGF